MTGFIFILFIVSRPIFINFGLQTVCVFVALTLGLLFETSTLITGNTGCHLIA